MAALNQEQKRKAHLNAMIFSGRNGLDFSELRAGVVRIPEVTVRLRQAQAILDSQGLGQHDLLSLIVADDELFFRNIKLKGLIAAVVQVGLYDRFLKTQRRPDFMLGQVNGDSALMVCTGRMSFEEMVRGSQALETLRQPAERLVISLVAEPAPLLSGMSLTEYRVFELRSNDISMAYEAEGETAMELRKLVTRLHRENLVNRFINIGPGSSLSRNEQNEEALEDFESLDSIELDPMLGWFWRSIRVQAVAQ